jgi:hypothetical protein
VSQTPRNRRIDRIRDEAYVQGLDRLSVGDLRARRDECLAEREHLSLLRRLVQGRAEILQAELEARGDTESRAPLVERLAKIFTGDEHEVSSRGEAVRVPVPQEELLLARRRVERLVNDTELSSPGSLDDDALAAAIDTLADEEHQVSLARADVFHALDALQDELKRRYKEDPTLALR